MSGILSSNDTRQLNRIAASGIFEKVRNLRSRSGVDTILRRLLWELVQNAKDNAVISNNSCAVRVDIKIQLTEKEFIFSHNNGYFKVENIQGIIRRFSSEDKEGLDTSNSELLDCITGRFGTGFMTTHLLSEFVTVKGIFKDPEDRFRTFELHLDRRGNTLKELETAINTSIANFEDKIEKTQFSEFLGVDSWTSFVYELANDGFELSNKAIDGLIESLGYVLINLPTIRTITIERKGTIKHYQLANSDYSGADRLVIKEIQTDDEDVKGKGWISKVSGHLSVTIPVWFDERQRIIPLSMNPEQPRLFLDFPLVGSEILEMPFVVNSHQFEPSTERDGVFLADSNDENTKKNKAIFSEARDLYLELVHELSSLPETACLYSLVNFKKPGTPDWLSTTWYENEVLNFCRSALLNVPLVDTNGGERKPMNNEEGKSQIYFPFHSKEPLIDRIWTLSDGLWKGMLPNQQEAAEWARVIWQDCFKQTLTVLTEDIQEIASLQKLGETLLCNEEDSIAWLNDYFDLLNLEGNFILKVKNNEYSVIPNQLGNFYKAQSLKWDKMLPKEIKQVAEFLNIPIRSYLRDPRIVSISSYTDDASKQIGHVPLSFEEEAKKINNALKEGQGNGKAAINLLISLFAEDDKFPSRREFVYTNSLALLYDEIPVKTIIENWIPELWEYVDPARIGRLHSTIAEKKDLSTFDIFMQERRIENSKVWLIQFCQDLDKLAIKDLRNQEGYEIVPNQNGNFRALDALFCESENIDDTLLDISKELGADFREKLIDRDFTFIKIPDSRKIPTENVADAIMKAVRKLLELPERTAETTEIFVRIVDWFDSHTEQAKSLFRGLYENKHTLYSPEQIRKWREGHARNQELIKRDERVSAIMEKHQIKDFDELESRLSQVLVSSQPMAATELKDRADLLAAGIYNEAMGESLNSISKILRFSKANYSSGDYEYVKAILKRAVRNVLTHLQMDARYVFSSDINSLMVSTETITVISGVKKDGRDINLVIRPSDGEKVHVFYGAEFTALKYENTEFWIDNSTSPPEILTIGKILDYTATQIIPLSRLTLS